MFGPLQARPSCLCRYLPQAVGPYGSSLPCVAPRAASHEAIPWWMKELRLHPTVPATRPCQSVAQLLSTPVNVARPRLSPERGLRMGAIHRRHMITTDASMTGWGAVFEWKAGGVESGRKKVPLLAYKLPGTQGCLPGFEVFSPRSRGAHVIVRTDHMAVCSPHKPPRRFKVAHPWTVCAPSSPLVPRQVPLFEGGSRSGSTEPGGRFSVETEAQAGGMMLNRQTVSQIWDLFGKAEVDLFASQESSQCPLWFSLSFPTTLGIDCVRPTHGRMSVVCVSANKADSGPASSTMQSEGERCPSPSHSPILALPDLVLGANSLLYRPPWEDSDQAGTYCPSFRARSGILNRSLEVVGMAHTGPRACD